MADEKSKIKCDLKLKGYVGGWDFDKDYVDWFLNKHANDKVTIVIDSLGGELTTAQSIAASIKFHGNVHVHYVGYNASAATLVSTTAKHVSIDENSMYLVHKCLQYVWTFDLLNADALEEYIKTLDKTKQALAKFDLNLAAMYAARCKKTQQELLELMSKDTWLTAKEALEWGFVDEIVSVNENPQGISNKEKLSDVVISAMAAEGIPIPPGYEQDRQKKDGLIRKLLDFFTQHAPKDILSSESSPVTEDASEDASENVSSESVSEPCTTNHNSDPTMTNKTFTLICALLAVETLASADGKITLTDEQLQKIENELASLTAKIQDKDTILSQKDSQISQLQSQLGEKNNQITNLKESPGAETTAVVNTEAGTDRYSSDFERVMAETIKLYNSI